MKNLLLLACSLFIAGFSHAQLKDGSYALSRNESLITWEVDYSIGTKGHAGTLSFVSGTLTIKNGSIAGGNFVLDMNSVHVTDLKPDDGGKDLEKHLKDSDFLSTAQYPKGYFTVLSAERNAAGNVAVSGYLILKGISNTVKMPTVMVTDTKTGVIVKSELSVNRTLWGINYQSGLFGAIKNEAISDNMNIGLQLVFSKAR